MQIVANNIYIAQSISKLCQTKQQCNNRSKKTRSAHSYSFLLWIKLSTYAIIKKITCSIKPLEVKMPIIINLTSI